MHAIATSTDTYTVQPFAIVPVDGDAAGLLNAIQDALTEDGRALGAVVGYDYERQEVDAIFQIEIDRHAFPTTKLGGATIEDATHFGFDVFLTALRRAGVDISTPEDDCRIKVMLGDDPDLLP